MDFRSVCCSLSRSLSLGNWCGVGTAYLPFPQRLLYAVPHSKKKTVTFIFWTPHKVSTESEETSVFGEFISPPKWSWSVYGLF